MTRYAWTWGLALVAVSARGGEFNKVLSVGDKAPAFSNLEGTDGRRHSLDEFRSKKAVVIVFTCNSCPVANLYEDRVAALARKYADGPDANVAVVAINVNTVPDDRLDKMTERAKKKKYSYPYLYDPSQKIARDYGAMYTPEFFVLDGDRKVAYLGAFDDKNKAEDAKEQFLFAALDAVLAGKAPPKGETLARGCKIRFTTR
jgi:peroxiredoxin